MIPGGRFGLSLFVLASLTVSFSCITDAAAPGPVGDDRAAEPQRSSSSTIRVESPNGDTVFHIGDTMVIVVTCAVEELLAAYIELSVDDARSWAQISFSAMSFEEWDGRVEMHYVIPDSLFVDGARMSCAGERCHIQALAYEHEDDAFDRCDRPFAVRTSP